MKTKVAVLLVLSFLLWRPAQAAPTILPPTQGTNFSMPVTQVVRLGADKFMESYCAKTRNYSTQGQMEGYDYYTRSRRIDNNRRAQPLSVLRRRQIKDARETLSQLGEAAWNMTEARNGGGTMWQLMASAAYASREDFLGVLIAPFSRRASHSATAKHHTKTLFAKTQRSLLAYQNPKLEAFSNTSLKDAHRNYRASWLEAKTAANKLQNLANALPDNAASLVAQRTFDEWNNSVKED